MARLLLKRLTQTIPLLLGISILSFSLIALTPGDPLSDRLTNPRVSRETVEALRHQLGLDLPIHVRYGRWLRGLVQGDWGLSLQYMAPVWTVIRPALVNTLILSVSATLISWLIGIPLGVLAALWRGGWVDRACSLLAQLALSTPRMLLALLALLLAAKTGWFPIGGQYSASFDRLSSLEKLMDALHHLVLPALILSLAPLAMYLRQTRGNLLQAMTHDYVRLARAKGLSERVVVVKHALRAALNPVITLVGYSVGNLLSGSALVETIMAWPGLGRMTVEAVFARDIYVLMAAVMMASGLLIAGNLLADVLLGVNDPRIKLQA